VLPPDTTVATAADLPMAVRDVVEPFVVRRKLLPGLQLTTSREVRRLTSDGRELCELAFDRVVARRDGREVAFAELELEVIDDVAGTERLADALRQRLPVLPAEDDKPHCAARLLGVPLPTAPGWQLSADQALGDVLPHLLAAQLDVMRRAEVEVRLGRGATALHTMRVAVRRLRTLVRTFRSLWPEPAAEWQQTLAATGHELGLRRDADVAQALVVAGAQHLPAALQEPARDAVAALGRQQAAADARLQQWLRSDARLDALDAFTSAATAAASAVHEQAADLATAPPPTNRQPLGIALAPYFRKAIATVRELAGALPPDLPIAEVHALRLGCKRMRYLAEAFAELPGHDYGRSLVRLAALQQGLGLLCDQERAVDTLLGTIAAATEPLPAPVAAAFGALAMRHQAAARKARKAASRLLERTDRKKVWRRFPGGEEDDANLAS
jgi:CHAD domain-containing protein